MKASVDAKTFATAEATEQISMMASQIYNDNSFPGEAKANYLGFARDQMVSYSATVPMDARSQFLTGASFRKMSNYEKGIMYLTKAVELSPKKQTTLLELSLAYLQSGDMNSFLEITKEAYDLDHSFPETQLAYAGALILNERKTEGKELIAQLVNRDEEGRKIAYTNPVLLNIFVEEKDYDALIDIWTYRVEADPGDTNKRISLAASYFEGGYPERAIEVIEKAIELNPDFKVTGESYIADMKAGRLPQ